MFRNFTAFHDQFLGFLFGGVKWLRDLIIGQDAPMKVIKDSIQLLGYVPFLLIMQNQYVLQHLFLFPIILLC